MKLVLSPAKSLNFESDLPTSDFSEACFLNEAKRLNTLLKVKSPKALSSLMKISAALGTLNYNRNQEWSLPFTPDNSRPSIYAFSGDVYKGIDAYTIPDEKIEKLQSSVRILSGLYGVLKPLDLVQPYRLEMGTKFPVGKHKNLYEYWRTKVTKALNDELQEDELFLNLASVEYFKTIDVKALKVPVINITFLQYKEGKYKNIAIFSKGARGLMTRYIIDTDAKSIDDIKGFNYDNYGFDSNQSTQNNLVFTR